MPNEQAMPAPSPMRQAAFPHASARFPGALPRPLRGIIPPMVTPLRGRDELDTAGLERLIEHILAGGVHGLFILGTSGEGPGLSYRLRRELIDRTGRQVKNRVPLLVGITDTSVVELLNLGRYAADAGCAALVLSAPYYFPPSQQELLGFIERILPELPLPLFLYNMPQMTKVVFEPDTLQRALQHEKVVGVKDSSGDLDYFDRLLALKRERPDWSVLIGQEDLLPEALRRGGDGGVHGSANYQPQWLVKLFQLAQRGDWIGVEEFHRQLLVLSRIYSVEPHASSVVRGIKCACSLTGLCDDFMAEPFRRFGQSQREKIQSILREAGLHL